MTALVVHGLHRFFHAGDEEVTALRDVGLEARAGEIVALAGPSGSGKSTLLACIAGLDEPDAGTVWICGERMSRRPEPVRASLRARRIGILQQARNLVGHLTVADNVRLVLMLAGRPRSTSILEEADIAHRARARPRELSGGELARAGLAVALANDPAVILADEPTGELDSATGARVLDVLRERARRGAAVVVVTHSRAVAHRADRELRLAEGRLG